MTILLTSKPVRVIKVLKTTKAHFFKDVDEGTILNFSMPLKSPGRGRTLYATYVTVENVATGEKTQYSLTQLSIMANYEFEELERPEIETAYERGRQDGRDEDYWPNA